MTRGFPGGPAVKTLSFHCTGAQIPSLVRELRFCMLQVKVKVKSLSRVRLFATPWTVAYQAPLSMGFSRPEYWSGLPFPSPCCKRRVAKGVAKKKARLTLQQRRTMKENSELFSWKHSVFSLSFHILFLITELGANIALTATPLLGKPQIPTPI